MGYSQIIFIGICPAQRSSFLSFSLSLTDPSAILADAVSISISITLVAFNSLSSGSLEFYHLFGTK